MVAISPHYFRGLRKMKWFKHLTESHDDEKLALLQAEFGLEGYGFYWLTLEIIAKQMAPGSEKTFVEYPITIWRKFYGFSPKKLRKFAGFCSEFEIFSVKFSEKTLRIDCPNLLKYRDEWSRKKPKNSGVTTEQLLCKDKDTDKEKEYTGNSAEQPGDKPKKCSDEQWEKYRAYSREVLERQRESLGKIVKVTEASVLAGAKALDGLVRIDGYDPKGVYETIEWALQDSFWDTQVRSLGSLRDKSRNGESKFSNIWTARFSERRRVA